MKTVLDAKIEAAARVLVAEPTTWGKAEAETAGKVLQKLEEKGEIDRATFMQAYSELCGNHSQQRQQFEKWGIFATSAAKPAMITGIEKRMEELSREADADLAANAAKPTPPAQKPKAG